MGVDEVIISSAGRILAEELRLPFRRLESARAPKGADAVFVIDGTRFAVDAKTNATRASVSQSVAHLVTLTTKYSSYSPLLIVPTMGEIGAEICGRNEVNWLDLRGNAWIVADGLRIQIRGRRIVPSTTPTIEEPAAINPFSRKAARVAHVLLSRPRHRWSRQALQDETNLGKGYVSRIVSELLARSLITERPSPARTLEVSDPMLLLDAWSEKYKPPSFVAWGLVASQDGLEAMDKLSALFGDEWPQFAFGGLASAYQYTRFASFRRIDVYVKGAIPDRIEKRLRIAGDKRGRNVAIHFSSENAFIDTTTRNDRTFTSPMLTYLDLAHLQERSSESREAMRNYLERQWA